jgi:PA domain
MSNKWIATLATSLSTLCSAAHAANFSITFVNQPGVGFNDPTPTAPVGGNPGTTLGEQRQYAFLKAADRWGAALTSVPEIGIEATFAPLNCTETAGTLGSAGPSEAAWNFPGAQYEDTFYYGALANKLAGKDLFEGAPVIRANFNFNLGKPGCLSTRPFYLGLDSNPPPGQVDLVVVVLHEFGHGLGFSSLTNLVTGEQPLNQPTIFDQFIYDTSIGKYRAEMSNAERATSATNTRRVVWTGFETNYGATRTLSQGVPNLRLFGPNVAREPIIVTPAAFGPQSVGFFGAFGEVVQVRDVNGSLPACAALDAATTSRLRGNIALIDRGECAFTEKVKRVQAAGAAAAIIVENTPIGPADSASADPEEGAQIRIPTASIMKVDGDAIRAGGSRGFPPYAQYSERALAYKGTDTQGRMLMWTPNPLSGGSTLSHFDISATRNLLMEPAFSVGLTQNLIPPFDLTLPLFRDIGW